MYLTRHLEYTWLSHHWGWGRIKEKKYTVTIFSNYWAAHGTRPVIISVFSRLCRKKGRHQVYSISSTTPSLRSTTQFLFPFVLTLTNRELVWDFVRGKFTKQLLSVFFLPNEVVSYVYKGQEHLFCPCEHATS